MNQNDIPTNLDFLYSEAEGIDGISLKESPMRFDIAAPIITEWTNLKRERLDSFHSKRDQHKFLQSVISIADSQIPYERKEIKKLVKAGISFVSVLFGRTEMGYPAVMLRGYVPADHVQMNFERLTTVLSKTYCNEEGVSWEELVEDIEILGIKDEMISLLTAFHKALHEAKNRDEFEESLTSHVIRLV